LPQLIWSLLGQAIEQHSGLNQILRSLGVTWSDPPLRNNQLVHGIPLGRGNRNVDPASMQDDGRFGGMNEEIQEAKRLGIRAKCREALRLVRVPALIWGQEIDSQTVGGPVGDGTSSIVKMRDGAKTVVDRFQDVEHRYCGVVDRHRNIGEL